MGPGTGRQWTRHDAIVPSNRHTTSLGYCAITVSILLTGVLLANVWSSSKQCSCPLIPSNITSSAAPTAGTKGPAGNQQQPTSKGQSAQMTTTGSKRVSSSSAQKAPSKPGGSKKQKGSNKGPGRQAAGCPASNYKEHGPCFLCHCTPHEHYQGMQTSPAPVRLRGLPDGNHLQGLLQLLVGGNWNHCKPTQLMRYAQKAWSADFQ